MRLILAVLLSCFYLHAQLLPLASSDSLKSYVTVLGADKMQGRATGSSGLKIAASFISNKLGRYNLVPKGHNNSWYQPIPMHGTKVLPSSTLQIYFQNNNQYLFYGKDFILIKSGGEAYNPGLLPVVFVGYGITAPEFEYDDYTGVDVSGKFVIFFDGEPLSDDPEYFVAEENTIYALRESKIRTAISHGAVGSIIIYSPSKDKTDTWARKRSEYTFEEVTLPGRVTGHVALYLNPEKADLLLKGTGKTYGELLKRKSENSLHSFPLKTKVAFNGDFEQREFKSNNILATIEGRDSQLKSKYLFVGAHYDHLGIGEQVDGDSIYNGVMDNAVGTAVVMELARMFSQADFKPKRSIIFGFFTGEEKGLLGSSYYTSHPQIDLKNTFAMINVDGLSAVGKFKSLIAVGGQYSDLGNSLENVANEYGLQLERLKLSEGDRPFTKSDQISFAKAGVPAIQILEGYSYPSISREEVLKLTQQWFKTYYHTVYDDLNQPIDYNSISRYTNLLFAYCNRLLNQKDEAQWCTDSPFQRKIEE